MTEEQSVLKKIKVFAIENISLQHYVLSYEIDLYVPKHRLAVEGDEKWDKGRDQHKGVKRENTIREHLGCKFIKMNPNGKDFDMFVEIGKSHDHMEK